MLHSFAAVSQRASEPKSGPAGLHIRARTAAGGRQQAAAQGRPNPPSFHCLPLAGTPGAAPDPRQRLSKAKAAAGVAFQRVPVGRMDKEAFKNPEIWIRIFQVLPGTSQQLFNCCWQSLPPPALLPQATAGAARRGMPSQLLPLPAAVHSSHHCFCPSRSR